MPEGDTVEKLARALGRSLTGAVLESVCVWGEPVAALRGATVTRVFARGKHLLIETDAGLMVRSHLGMRGTWHRYRPGEPWQRPAWQAALALATAGEVLACFNAREVECLRAAGLRHRDLAAQLGPSLLDPGLDPARLAARARHGRDPLVPLADLLLDQWVASGIGNVYKCEVLFLEGCHPLLDLGAVDDDRLARLYTRARELMGRNLGRGPRATRATPDAQGPLWVYGRQGRPCLRCGTRIRYARLGRGARATYWCPHCQPGPGA